MSFYDDNFEDPDKSAYSMNPYEFSSRFNGDIREERDSIVVNIKGESYIWERKSLKFIGKVKEEFSSPEIMKIIEKEKKRIIAAIESGELTPNLDEISKKTAEEFADEMNAIVILDYTGQIKQVSIDNVLYIWRTVDGVEEFIGAQLIMKYDLIGEVEKDKITDIQDKYVNHMKGYDDILEKITEIFLDEPKKEPKEKKVRKKRKKKAEDDDTFKGEGI